jgi:hypothetical protein
MGVSRRGYENKVALGTSRALGRACSVASFLPGLRHLDTFIRQGRVMSKDLLHLSLPRDPIHALVALSWDRVSHSSTESIEHPSGHPLVSESVSKADMKEAVADLEPDDVEKFDVQKYDDGVSLLLSTDGDEITYLWLSVEDAEKLAGKLKAKSKADKLKTKSKGRGRNS